MSTIIDNVNSPNHYKFKNGAETIDLTENLNFCRGNAVKYLSRAGKKEGQSDQEDLNKAAFYLFREMKRLGYKLTAKIPNEIVKV